MRSLDGPVATKLLWEEAEPCSGSRSRARCLLLIKHEGLVRFAALDFRDVEESLVRKVYAYSSVGVDVSRCLFDGDLARVYP